MIKGRKPGYKTCSTPPLLSLPDISRQCVLARKLKAADERATKDLARLQQPLQVTPFTPPVTAGFSFAALTTDWITTTRSS